MVHEIGRRTVLKGIAAGAVTLNFAGPVTAESQTRYLASARGDGVKRRLERAGFAVHNEIADGDVLVLTGPEGGQADLEGVKGVQHVTPDFAFELERPAQSAEFGDQDHGLPHIDDSLHPLQWDKDVTDVPDAHDTATGDGTTIAIIDTGVGVNHPNLAGNLDLEDGGRFRFFEVESDLEDETPADTPFQRGTGSVEVPVDRGDPTQGTKVVDDEMLANDVDGHGTNVAGIAAADASVADPDIGVLGVTGTAPDATVVPLRVFYWIEADVEDEEGNVQEDVASLFTTTGDILLAIDYAASLGVDVMNMSIGTAPIPPQGNRGGIKAIWQTVIESAVRRGSVVVVSAGNSDADLQHGGTFTLPNSVAGAMSISATGPNDLRTFFSNFGTNEISVGAPGGGYETLVKTLCTPAGVVDGTCEENDEGETECVACEPGEWPFPFNLVFNAYMVDADGDGVLDGPTYSWLAGTSMAAPQVTGAAALVRQVAPNATAKQVEQAIEQGADLVRGKNDPELGAGRLNANGAIDAASKRGRGP